MHTLALIALALVAFVSVALGGPDEIKPVPGLVLTLIGVVALYVLLVPEPEDPAHLVPPPRL